MQTTLLPSGLMDVLPPFAAAEFRLIHHFLKTFSGFGYQPVIPPLAEFTDTLLADQGAATGHHVFRMNDPLSTQMLALRADITGQVARIASTSLKHEKRPLRLCYAGYTLRTAPEALKTLRQHTQVGIERFGDQTTNAVAEVLAIAAHALATNGIDDITIDLHFPSVMESLLQDFPADTHESLREAVRLKDAARLKSLKADTISALMNISGDATAALTKLTSVKHKAIADAAHAMSSLVDALKKQKLNATLTIDLLDLSGYGYYNGIGYALYWNKAGIEVGRGGCYHTSNGEEAVGFTLYINELLEQLGAEAAPTVKIIPYGTPVAEAAKLQKDGFITIFADSTKG